MESEFHIEQALSLAFELLKKLNIDVRFEVFSEDPDFKVQSGVVRLEAQKTLLLDSRLNKREQLETVLETLRQCDLDQVFVPPLLREWLFASQETP